MTEPWFSMEFAENLKWLSLLSLLSILVVFPLNGLYRRAITSIWLTALAFGVICLAAFGIAQATGQPAHVLRPLFAMGLAMTVAFGGTFALMRRGYHEADLRKMAARDI